MEDFLKTQENSIVNNPITVWNLNVKRHQKPYRHDYIMIAYVKRGTGFHCIENQKIPICEGDIFVIHPGVKHIFHCDSLSSLSLYYCCFYPKAINDYYSGLKHSFPELKPFFDKKGNTHLQLHDTLNREIQKLFIALLENYNSNLPGREYTIKCHTIILLAKIFQVYTTKENTQQKSANKIVDEAICYIIQHLNKKLTLEMIAQEQNISISVSQLNRLFRKHTGSSIIQYINHLRIEKIKYLLVNTTRPIDIIAQEFTFTTKYLNRLFKIHTGFTMNQYRKQYHDSHS